MFLKLPPIEKIYEAYGALADQRLKQIKTGSYEVTSSNRDKLYQVKLDGKVVSATDAASLFQGYPGYPILTVFMKEGLLPYSEEIISHFKEVPWNDLNKKYKRDYKKVCDLLLDELKEKGIDTDFIQTEVNHTYQKLAELDWQLKRNIPKSR